MKVPDQFIKVDLGIIDPCSVQYLSDLGLIVLQESHQLQFGHMVRVDHLFGHDPGVTGPEDGYLDFFTKLRPVEKKHILDQQAVIKLKQEGGKDDNQQYRIGNQVLKQRVQQTNAIINAG